MDQVTTDEVKAAIVGSNVKRWKLHNCSMCGYPCSYLFAAEDVGYDAGCDCVSYHNIRPSSYGEVADTLNMQKPEIRQRMWDEMIGKAEAA
jgi:hypothetical protein